MQIVIAVVAVVAVSGSQANKRSSSEAGLDLLANAAVLHTSYGSVVSSTEKENVKRTPSIEATRVPLSRRIVRFSDEMTYLRDSQEAIMNAKVKRSRFASDTRQAAALEPPSPKHVSQSVRLLDGPEATYLLGLLVYVRPYILCYSVVGSSELFVTYYLDNKNDKEHIAQQCLTFSLRAHASGIGHQPIGIGEAFQLPIDDSDKRGAFYISVKERRELREKGYTVVPVVYRSIGPVISPIDVKISHRNRLGYYSLLQVNQSLLNSLQLLHEDAKLIHGCISPTTVRLTKRAQMVFSRSPRSALIENQTVIELEPGSKCHTDVPQEFLPPWDLTTPSQADDLWATQMLITWIGCPNNRFPIPTSITHPDSLWVAKVEMTEVSRECETQGVEDAVMRQKLGSLRQAMWDAILFGLNPYDDLRSLIKESMKLIEGHEQRSS